MLQRIEVIHSDMKLENFVVGLNDKSSTVYTIDYGLSERYKDKNTEQHIPYRENRLFIGTAPMRVYMLIWELSKAEGMILNPFDICLFIF
jgi:serine/threonine protein kinase